MVMSVVGMLVIAAPLAVGAAILIGLYIAMHKGENISGTGIGCNKKQHEKEKLKGKIKTAKHG